MTRVFLVENHFVAQPTLNANDFDGLFIDSLLDELELLKYVLGLSTSIVPDCSEQSGCSEPSRRP